MADTYDAAVIGSGIVGLATARELLLRQPQLRVAVVEKEATIAVHQSGRNSGVIHAGLYYTPGSLRSRLCREGRALLLAFAEENDIPYRLIGKLVVAVGDREAPRLRALHERGLANGLQGLRMLTGDAAREIEPNVAARRALHVPESGIIDYRIVAKALARQVEQAGGSILLGHEVVGVHTSARDVTLETRHGGVTSRDVISCSGAGSDRIARLAGVDTSEHRIVPFRGSYHSLAPPRRSLINGLVYPVPDPSLPFLGVHFTPRMDGEVLLGPNAVLAFARDRYGRRAFAWRDVAETASFPGFWRLARRYPGYAAAEISRDLVKPLLLRELRRYVPTLRAGDVKRGFSGTRAQLLSRNGVLVDDFVVSRSPRMLHVLNAPSPAATAALAIARLVVDEAVGRLDAAA
jgi:L-2-hydroxyglutarate oxidase LhgO